VRNLNKILTFLKNKHVTIFGEDANNYGFFRLLATLKETINQYLNHPVKHTSTLLSSIEIDTGIAPLIDEIWKAEIQTTGSCEDVFPGIYGLYD